METLIACPLGRLDYDEAWNLQRRLLDRMVEAKRAGEAPPHLLLLVEHPHVFTLGKSGDRANLLLSEAELAERDATFREIERGGDITYHGPGQLVAYPILDLDRFFRDLHRYLRTLEDAVIQTCAAYGVEAGRSEGRTGVWVGPDARGAERKICAMGIRCSRWVTMHGLALNVQPDLDYFGMIVPCGISDRGVTSLARETGRDVDVDEAARRLTERLGGAFGADVRWCSPAQARPFLEAFAAGSDLEAGATEPFRAG